MADPTGYYNPGASQFASAVPPAAVLQAMGISQWDPSQYGWDPINGILTDRSNGSSLNFGNGGADPSLGTNVVSPDGSVQNFAQGTTPVFSDVGNGTAFGLPTADAYKWYADQKSGNQKDFLAAAAGLIGGPLLAGALSGAGGAVGDAGAAGGAGAGSAAGGGAGATTFGLDPLTAGFGSTITGGEIGGSSSFLGSILGPAGGAAGLGSTAPAVGDALSSVGSGGGSVNSPVSAGPDPDMMAGGALSASGLPDWLKSILPYSSLIGGGLGLIDSLLQPDSKTTTQGGTSQSVQQSQLQLPSQITGAAGTALDRANELLGKGRQFAPLPSVIARATDNIGNLGQNTAPTTSSFANGANINPYLDTEFNAAADSTQNRLGTEFAAAGQSMSPQHQGARSQELQTLAAGIFGPGYENAYNRQYGAQEAGVQRGLTQADSNLNRTLQAAPLALQLGQYQQGQTQQQLDSPTTSLDQYIGQLGGLSPYYPGTQTQSQATNQNGSVTQPLYNNPVLGALGGASLGGYLGNLYAPQQAQQPQQQGQNMQIQPYAQNPYAYM
jgi:hypothetical protein